ncbi:MAG: polysaccharide biosynthesis tyrosine autokinase [Steroidobacteraceae bacterium]|nr:polysaccharide biosynthesis tyrosine autokinase [Deltaproteobacteria bacterium]
MQTHLHSIIAPDDTIRGTFIGDILHKAGRLTEPDQKRIVALQGKEQILFGDAAVALGILSEEDVRWALASQYSYPGVTGVDSSLSAELLVVHAPFSQQVETFRSIRSGLLLSGVGALVKTLAILSPAEEEGRTFFAANLAVVFAQLGSRTILVDLNFRKPRVHEVFHLKNNSGASSLIIKRALMEQAIQPSTIEGLDILTSGPKPPNPLELLSWQETKNLIATLRETYDVVILDTPAFSKTADALHIASLCDGNLLVARKGKTRQADFGQLKKQLEATGAKILGAVVNEVTIKK